MTIQHTPDIWDETQLDSTLKENVTIISLQLCDDVVGKINRLKPPPNTPHWRELIISETIKELLKHINK